jgi:GPH family glycoside/pentoside/hexuronide:cation symporter
MDSLSDSTQKNPDSELQEKLYLTTKLSYAAGDMGTAITANILVFYLLPFLTNVAGLSPAMAGSVLMIGKICDAINDPIVGVLSDRTRTVWGRRLPWMLIGAIPFGLFFLLEWIVPHFSDNQFLNTWLLFGYYVVIGIIFNIAYTAINLPYTALTPELTQDYNERTNLNSFRFAFSIGSSIISLILAKLTFSAYENAPEKQYFILGLICTILAVISVFWSVFVIQERGAKPFLNKRQKDFLGKVLLAIALSLTFYSIIKMVSGTVLISVITLITNLVVMAFAINLIYSQTESHLNDENAKQIRKKNNTETSLPFLEQLRIAFNNRAFLYVIGIYLCSWLAVQLTASILVYFVVDWMGLPNEDSPLVALSVQGTALLLLFFWSIVSEKKGKKVAYFLGTAIWMTAQAGLFLLQPQQVGLLYVLAILAGCGVSVAYLIPWSMIPDVIELDELKTGQRREGIFYGFMVLLQKIGLALGLFIVGIALEISGFINSVAGEAPPIQPASALLAIRIAVGPLPTAFLLLGLVLAYFYPITQEVHGEIRLKLQERKQNNALSNPNCR